MSTATIPQKQTRYAEPPQEVNLDAVLEATKQRAQSIRATAAAFLGVPANKVCDLLRNVWKTSKGQPPLTDPEMFMGMSMIARFGLDPIAKEVYVTRTKNGLATIVGIDGWVKILNRTEDYDGFEAKLIWKDDKEGSDLLAVETTIYSKARRPTTYKGYAKEYMELSGFMAGKIPWHMLRIFSLRHAARLFTPVGGSVVTEEEARWMDAYEPQQQSHTVESILGKMPETEYAPSPQYEEESRESRPEPQQEKPSDPEDPKPAPQSQNVEVEAEIQTRIAMIHECKKTKEIDEWTSTMPAHYTEEQKGRVLTAAGLRRGQLLPVRGERANGAMFDKSQSATESGQ